MNPLDAAEASVAGVEERRVCVREDGQLDHDEGWGQNGQGMKKRKVKRRTGECERAKQSESESQRRKRRGKSDGSVFSPLPC